MSEISDRYRRLSQAFADKVAQVPDDRWDAPAPCEGWTARDVVKHVAETPSMFFGLIGQEPPQLPDDPIAALPVARERMQAALDDEATATTEFDGFMGRSSFQDAVVTSSSPSSSATSADTARVRGPATGVGWTRL